MLFFNYDKKHKKLKEKLAADPDAPFELREVFEDEALAQHIAQILGISSIKTPTTLSRLARIEKLDAKGLGITSLEGIECLNGLVEADFKDNHIHRLPDYTSESANLYKNKQTLVYMDLSGNPVSDPNDLFSFEASENRRRFIQAFEGAQNRFYLGEVGTKVFDGMEPSPELILRLIEKNLPASIKQELSEQEISVLLEGLLLRFAAGKRLYAGEEIWNGALHLIGGVPSIRLDQRIPAFSTTAGKKAVDQDVEKLLRPDDVYLARAVALSYKKPLPDFRSCSSVSEAIENVIEQGPFTEAYVKGPMGYEKSDAFMQLTDSVEQDEDRELLTRLLDPNMKNTYRAYLRVRSALQSYLDDHPDKSRNILKMMEKNDAFSKDYLKQYLALQDNSMLSDDQKQKLMLAAQSFRKFYEGYEKDVRAFFDQDLFNLEVEMKYIDMLEEARKEIRK